MSTPPPSIEDVRRVLKDIEKIERPDGDNEGEPINSPGVYDYLSPEDQDRVDCAVETLSEYIRNGDGEANKRSLTTLRKNGYEASFGESQYNRMRQVGTVSVGDWEIDVSDPANEGDD